MASPAFFFVVVVLVLVEAVGFFFPVFFVAAEPFGFLALALVDIALTAAVFAVDTVSPTVAFSVVGVLE